MILSNGAEISPPRRPRDVWTQPTQREWYKGAKACAAGHSREPNPWTLSHRSYMTKFEWAWWQGYDACTSALTGKPRGLLALLTPKQHKRVLAGFTGDEIIGDPKKFKLRKN